MAGEPQARPGRHEDQAHTLDAHLDCIDRNIAGARGDAPLQAFWRGEKTMYQADLSRQDETAATVRLIALDEGPDIAVNVAPVIVGRDPRCDARLDSIRVSRFHCFL